MRAVACFILLLYGAIANAEARINSTRCYFNDNQLTVDIDATLLLPPAPNQAVRNGLTLNLVYDLDLSIAGHWWQHFPRQYYRQRLSYNPISQQFILDNSSARLSFANISDALTRATRIQALPITMAKPVTYDATYQLAVRLRLDKEQLPVSLRLDAFFNADWHIESDWLSCQLVL